MPRKCQLAMRASQGIGSKPSSKSPPMIHLQDGEGRRYFPEVWSQAIVRRQGGRELAYGGPRRREAATQRPTPGPRRTCHERGESSLC